MIAAVLAVKSNLAEFRLFARKLNPLIQDAIGLVTSGQHKQLKTRL